MTCPVKHMKARVRTGMSLERVATTGVYVSVGGAVISVSSAIEVIQLLSGLVAIFVGAVTLYETIKKHWK
jgi:hypothetical protein